MQKLLLVLALLSPHLPTYAQTVDRDDITGYWLTDKEDAVFWIYRAKNGNYYGKLVWQKDPIDPETGKERVDRNNEDPSQRSRTLDQMVIFKHFEWDGEDEWEDGRIYNPENGKTYRGYWEIVEGSGKNTLKLRGYLGMSLLGKTVYWQRTQRPTRRWPPEFDAVMGRSGKY